MNNKIKLISLLIIVSISSALSQSSERQYVLSYPYENSDTILISDRFINSKKQMTKQEALLYVYHNDTNRLTCKGEYYDMLKEKVTGSWKEEKLPKKCFGIKTYNYYLISYTSYDCQNPKSRQWNYLNLSIFDKDFNLTDTLIIYKGDEYDYEISSLINVKTMKIFLYKYNKVSNLKEFYIIFINPNKLIFETLKHVVSKDIDTDNLEKTIKNLGLGAIFYN